MAAFASLSRLPARSKAALGLTVLGVVLFTFFMFRLATAPSYATLVSGLDPAQTGKITSALDEQAIAYEIQNGGTALAVAKADTAKARIALAGQGIEVVMTAPDKAVAAAAKASAKKTTSAATITLAFLKNT